jgi:CheY-like chemotaxis protein
LPPAPSAPPALQPGRRGRILIVDDEPMAGAALRRILEREHDVVVVTRGRDALDQIAGAQFDVILCDLMMPEMSGMDLYTEVSRRSPEHAPRIIFMTGGAFTPRAREFLERVPNQRLEKPVDTRNLRALIRDLLR